MHPNKKEGVVGHNEKLRRLTRDYGDANPGMHKLAPVNRHPGEGSEEAVGYGAEDGKASPRSDRPARKSSAANPIATYKRGGAVRKRQMGGSIVPDNSADAAAALKRKVGANPTESERKAVEPGVQSYAQGRAMGGRLEGELGAPGAHMGGVGKKSRKSPSTNINIVIAPPQKGGAPEGGIPPMLAPSGGAGAPPAGPGGPGGPPPPGAAGGLPPGLPGGPGMVPPGAMPPGMPELPRKRGGRVDPFSKKQHPDEAEDQAMIKDMVKPSALKRARGGGIPRVGLTGGADGGAGRIEKAEARARRQSGDAKAEV